MLNQQILIWLILPGLSVCKKKWDKFPTHEIAPGVYLPEIMIGTWVIGSNNSKNEPEDSAQIVRKWLDLGGRGIDTAYYYQDQSMVAQAMASAGVKRSDVFIETKLPGCAGSMDEAKEWIDFCLNSLSTDYIDLMLIHYPSKTPQDCINTWKVLERYHKQGSLKAIGLSDFEIDDMNSLLPAASVMPAVHQLPVNVYFHNDEQLKFCKTRNITVQAWSPLGSPGREAWDGPSPIGHRSIFTDATLLSIAAAHNVSVAQVAMRWVLQRVPTAVFESSSTAHQVNDADVYTFTLSDAELAVLDNLQNSAQSLSVQSGSHVVKDIPKSRTHLPLVVLFCLAIFLVASLLGMTIVLKVSTRIRSNAPDPSDESDCKYRNLIEA